jgi:hypothetical protein
MIKHATYFWPVGRVYLLNQKVPLPEDKSFKLLLSSYLEGR